MLRARAQRGTGVSEKSGIAAKHTNTHCDNLAQGLRETHVMAPRVDEPKTVVTGYWPPGPPGQLHVDSVQEPACCEGKLK